ncbi:MAG TPA: GntR family transcriptional regulator [Bacillales bacterium]|nr:GntR family transcriptional regulator [Bacillales bacterium]
MVDKHSPLPIYYQLAEELRRRIEGEELRPGDLIPSERVLADKHGISRMTVRQAINSLVSEGLLTRRKGKGTYVASGKIEQPLQGLTSFTEEMKARGMLPTSRVVRFQAAKAPGHAAKELNLSADELVYEIVRIRMADGIPMAVETTFIPEALAPGLTREKAADSIYKMISDRHEAGIGYGKQVIEASAANQLESEYLGIPERAPVLLIRRKAFLGDGTPFESVKSIYRADRYQYAIDLNRIQQ